VLKTLNIGYNKIGDEGAAAIAEALRGNGVLKSTRGCDAFGRRGEGSDLGCGERAGRDFELRV